jgi:hypothetical protein
VNISQYTDMRTCLKIGSLLLGAKRFLFKAYKKGGGERKNFSSKCDQACYREMCLHHIGDWVDAFSLKILSKFCTDMGNVLLLTANRSFELQSAGSLSITYPS